MNTARKPRFYHPHSLEIGCPTTLSGESAQHITRVLRMKIGEAIILFNEQGGEYEGVIIAIEKNHITLLIQAHFQIERESALKLHLGQSLLRNDKMDFVIQKATELGVREITPLITTRSIIKLDAKSLEKKLNHWTNIIISAAQQCGRTQLPILNRPLPFQQFVASPFEGMNIGFCPLSSHSLKSIASQPTTIRLIVGPESGFEDLEMSLATQHNFTPYRLGPRVLRAETATITALSALQSLFGDL